MQKKYPNNKNSISQKPTHQIVNVALDEQMEEIIKKYLLGGREEAINKLAVKLRQPNISKLRPIIKNSIRTYVQTYRSDFEGKIAIKDCVYELFKNFTMADFLERKWEYRPYYISASDYQKIQTMQKNPIHIVNYNYAEPIYKLPNNIDYSPKDLKLHKRPLETIKNDLKFYLSKDENVVFAKLVNLKYSPCNLKAVKNHNRTKTPEEKAMAVYENYLYNRSLAISMFVLLDGDPNKAFPYVRYDSSPVPHTNIFIGHDKRKEIYGEVALSPHFHFQNENDSLLCLRKYDGRYRAGRCNAIDCKHLKKYLLDLDNMSKKELEILASKNLNYDMPFLAYKLEGHKFSGGVDRLFYNFIRDKSDDEINLLNELSLWLTHSKDAEIYNGGGCFDKLIRTLDCLERISLLMDNSINCDQRKLYSQLEIVIADSFINSICNNSQRYLLQEYQPKFTIETDLLEE